MKAFLFCVRKWLPSDVKTPAIKILTLPAIVDFFFYKVHFKSQLLIFLCYMVT